ncbi:hypothetical protein [Aureivirga sp. CE67]|uniref:hypothetical protein n=1 Tax=Aureivirga sp. CE67 TaxID=1788983 RepID=UPI0018C8E527|nr:hypothetical protein [Aureivirga sp. CE67]
MKKTIKYIQFFVFSETSDKSFYVKFEDGVNIIYGKNTSGKSTLLQSINYTFGINDEYHKLKEILSEDIIFRLDFEVKEDQKKKNYTIIRDFEFIYIKDNSNNKIEKFSGIKGNSSAEHKRLKKYITKLFGFDLFLQQKDEFILASIEAMFLPYYVAQDYGWVLTLKSFRGFDFYKNFKFDYYDYYLGIQKEFNREEKIKLEAQKKDLEFNLSFLKRIEGDSFKEAIFYDDNLVQKSIDYLEIYKNNKKQLIEKEKEYLLLSNEINYLDEHNKILRKINLEHSSQEPLVNDCPTCKQSLPSSIEKVYEFYQNQDDINSLKSTNKKKIKEKTGRLNTVKKQVSELKEQISKDYYLLFNYDIDGLTFEKWLDIKADLKLNGNINEKVQKLKTKVNELNLLLDRYNEEGNIEKIRNFKGNRFKKIFIKYLEELKVETFNEDYFLYRMKLFPQQGVELLKTLLAYNFAFNKLIKETNYVHRLPFVLDAIFKEDIDDTNRSLILKFIEKNKPNDTQIIFSIAQSDDNLRRVEDYNTDYFNNKAKLICINLEEKRAFLSKNTNNYKALIDETLNII